MRVCPAGSAAVRVPTVTIRGVWGAGQDDDEGECQSSTSLAGGTDLNEESMIRQ